jgi:hypothetical protein
VGGAQPRLRVVAHAAAARRPVAPHDDALDVVRLVAQVRLGHEHHHRILEVPRLENRGDVVEEHALVVRRLVGLDGLRLHDRQTR